MKESDVKIGNQYTTKVTNKLVTIEILAENPHGGWDAKNLATGKTVRIKSAQRLRGAATKAATAAPAGKAKQEPAKSSPTEKTPNTSKPVRIKRPSALDAAARILSEASEPMSSKQLIETMLEKDYWKPTQEGKTPANTLHAAISKEIKTKGADSRFVKVGRGQFALSTK